MARRREFLTGAAAVAATASLPRSDGAPARVAGMRNGFIALAVGAGFAVAGFSTSATSPLVAQPEATTVREVAITIDDLPAVSVVKGDPASLPAFTDRLLRQFAGLPVTGFVNQGKLTLPGEGLAQQQVRMSLLSKWLDAGFDLGNHTYSHRSLNEAPIEEFQADVVRGEAVVASLLGARGRSLRYFRHPYLHSGAALQKKRAFEAWLAARGYTVAPVTIDTDDYMFAAVYAERHKASDPEGARKVADAYLEYMDQALDFNEKLVESLFRRSIRGILLIHANEINADYGAALVARMKGRGYQFVTLEQALKDSAYATVDNYAGRFGISWLHRWEQTMGRQRTGAPDPPAWLVQAYGKGR